MAKFCSNCGKEVSENDNVCGYCGKAVNGNTVVNNTIINQGNNKSDGFAVAGFVLSLVSFLCCGGTSTLGLIFSIIGLVNCNKNNKNGKGLAIAGIIISSIGLITLVLLYSFGLISSITTELY